MTIPHHHVTAAFIVNKGRILIAQRKRGAHLEGMWEFPGGKREEGESLQDCLKREIKEELAVDIDVEKYLCGVDHKYGTFSITLHVFFCRLVKGVPKPVGVGNIMWVRPEEINNYLFSPADVDVIKLLKLTHPEKVREAVEQLP